LNERHLLDEYRAYFNASRPHQGIDQWMTESVSTHAANNPIPAPKPNSLCCLRNGLKYARAYYARPL
jgi:hypothetical protein